MVVGRAGGKGVAVLAAARFLAPGDTISASDLTSVNLKVSGGAVASIPASERRAVIGERVTGPLAAGTLLSPALVTSKGELAPGQVGLALALTPDRAAEGILAVGQSVLVVAAPDQAATPAGATQAPPVTIPAGVVGIFPGPASSGEVIVDLVVASPSAAAAVTAAAATQNGVRLAVLPGGTNGQ